MKFNFLALALLAPLTIMAASQPAVKSIEPIPVPQGLEVCNPVISPDGSFVVAQSLDSLIRIDLKSHKITPIAAAENPYCLKISPDGSRIAWLDASYTGPLRFVSALSIDSEGLQKPEVIVERSRSLSTGIGVLPAKVSAVDNNTLRAKSVSPTGRAKKNMKDMPFASTNLGHLDITYPDGTTVTLDPNGHGSYLWPSVSPDGTKVVYYLVARGCYVANIDGSNPTLLCDLHAPVWAGNDRIVGMMEYDDSERITSSTLYICDLQGNLTEITPADYIAVEPSASSDGRKIVFTALSDNLPYLITLSR